VVWSVITSRMLFSFLFDDAETAETYTLSLHDALPISGRRMVRCPGFPSCNFGLRGILPNGKNPVAKRVVRPRFSHGVEPSFVRHDVRGNGPLLLRTGCRSRRFGHLFSFDGHKPQSNGYFPGGLPLLRRLVHRFRLFLYDSDEMDGGR